MKLSQLAGPSLFTWAVAAFALLSCRYSCDALSIINTVPSTTRGWTPPFIIRSHRRRGERPFDTLLNFLSSNNDKVESLMHKDGHEHLTRDKYYHLSSTTSDCNFNNHHQLSRWNEIAQTFTSIDERGRRRNNLNKALSAAMMSMAIGMQPLLPACAHEYSITNNYERGVATTTTTIQSSSILFASSTTTSELRVKVDDTIATKKMVTEESAPSKSLSMGVKIEYTPEEIEMSIQAEKERLERMAQVDREAQLMKKEEEKQQQFLLAEEELKEQQLVNQKVEVETPTVATTDDTTKSVEQSPPPQQLPPRTTPSVQVVSPPPIIINTEKEELIKMLKDTSKTSKVTKQQQAPPSISPAVVVGQPVKSDDNNIVVMATDLVEELLHQIQLIGFGAVGAGLYISLNSKKGDGSSDTIVNNDGDSNKSPMPITSSKTESSSSPPPLTTTEQFKPIPPSAPPIYPTEIKLKKELRLLEDDLLELNKNLELLENDLYELNDDLESLQDDSNNVAPTDTAVSTASYLDSLAGSNQFELNNRSGVVGFQSSYLGSLGCAAPLEFGYEDSTTLMVQNNVDQASYYLSSVRDQEVEMKEVEESTTGNNQFELNRSGVVGFQSSYLGSLGSAAPLEFGYEDTTTSMVQNNVDQASHYLSSGRDQVEMKEVEESTTSPPPVSPFDARTGTGFDATSPTTVNSQRQIIETKSGRRLSINADIISDVHIDRPGQSSTSLKMFGTNYPRGRRSTHLYMSQNSDYEEEESLFPSTDALIEVLRQKKMEEDRRDAELRAQQQADVEVAMMAREEEEQRILAEQRQALQLEEQRMAAEVQRVREEDEQREREEQERILEEQRAKEEAALEMQLQMRMMAAEKKAEEEAMLEKFLLELRTKEEEAERRRQQEEAERLAAEQRANEEAELKARHEMRMKQEAEELLQIERSMSYLNDAMAQVDDRLDALSNCADGANLDIDDGIQYLNSAVSEIDSLLSEDDE